MIIYLDPLSPKDSSDLPGSYPSPSTQDESFAFGSGRGGQPLTPILGLALRWGLPGRVSVCLPRPVLPRERVVSYTTFSPLPFDPARGGTLRRYLFCGTFRPFRMTPCEPTSYVAPCPGELGLSSRRLRSGRSSILLWQH